MTPNVEYAAEALKTLESVRSDARGRASGATQTQKDHLEKFEGYIQRAMQEMTRLVRSIL